jgi:hypothetical protein
MTIRRSQAAPSSNLATTIDHASAEQTATFRPDLKI